MPMAESAVVNAGERLALQCAVVKGGLPLSLTWSKDGQLLTSGGHQQHQASFSGDALNGSHAVSVRLVNDFTASLTVESLSGQHAGSYVCRAVNEGGRAEASVQVVVQGKSRRCDRYPHTHTHTDTLTPFIIRKSCIPLVVGTATIEQSPEPPIAACANQSKRRQFETSRPAA